MHTKGNMSMKSRCHFYHLTASHANHVLNRLVDLPSSATSKGLTLWSCQPQRTKCALCLYPCSFFSLSIPSLKFKPGPQPIQSDLFVRPLCLPWDIPLSAQVSYSPSSSMLCSCRSKWQQQHATLAMARRCWLMSSLAKAKAVPVAL